MTPSERICLAARGPRQKPGATAIPAATAPQLEVHQRCFDCPLCAACLHQYRCCAAGKRCAQVLPCIEQIAFFMTSMNPLPSSSHTSPAPYQAHPSSAALLLAGLLSSVHHAMQPVATPSHRAGIWKGALSLGQLRTAARYWPTLQWQATAIPGTSMQVIPEPAGCKEHGACAHWLSVLRWWVCRHLACHWKLRSGGCCRSQQLPGVSVARALWRLLQPRARAAALCQPAAVPERRLAA